MPRHVPSVVLALAVTTLSACGIPTTSTAPGTPTAPAVASSATAATESPGPSASGVQVTTTGDTIVLTGSGAAETPAMALDKPYYVYKVTLPTGQMLASASLFDAATGLEVMQPVYVNKAKPTDKASRTVSAAGAHFLIIRGASAADPWEVTLTTG